MFTTCFQVQMLNMTTEVASFDGIEVCVTVVITKDLRDLATIHLYDMHSPGETMFASRHKLNAICCRASSVLHPT